MSSRRQTYEGTLVSKLHPDDQNVILINRDTLPQLGNSRSNVEVAFSAGSANTEQSQQNQLKSDHLKSDSDSEPTKAENRPKEPEPDPPAVKAQDPHVLSTERLAYHVLHLSHLSSGLLQDEDVKIQPLNAELKATLTAYIKEKQDFFAWSHISLTALDDPGLPSGQRLDLVNLLIDLIYECTVYLGLVLEHEIAPPAGARFARKEAICRLVIYSFIDPSGDHFSMSIKALARQARQLGYDSTLRPLAIALFKPLTARAANLWP